MDKEMLKKALKELFKSDAIDICVKRAWNDWEGEFHVVSVAIDGETVYTKKCIARISL